jgi:pyruvate,orthophosphate dikinase
LAPVRETAPAHRIPFERADGDLPGREIVGSKAANLMTMARLGLPVPPGFVLGTEWCRAYMRSGTHVLKELEPVIRAELKALEQRTKRGFGDPKRPLLVSVRSGAAVSMPGMMETVLNVGLTATTVPGVVRMTGNPRLALDCRRRLLEQYAEVVHAVEPAVFDDLVAKELAASNVAHRHQLDAQSLRRIVQESEVLFAQEAGMPLPDAPLDQLMATVEAVLKSWNSERAKTYRRLNSIPDSAGTAVIVQMMVFGNAGPTSGSGVGFTRNPADGTDAVYVDYLPNAQGEDVVSGRRNALGSADLERRVPEAWRELVSIKDALEGAFADMQDFEFTIEDGRLFMLQARSGKRTPLAALRIAHDLVASGLVSPKVALGRLEAINLEEIACRELVPEKGAVPIAKAIAASTGVTVGVAVMDPARVQDFKKRRVEVVLIRDSAETSDIEVVAEADAIVTRLGARTSHAAVVARQLGKVCLVGCDALRIDSSARSCRFGERVIHEGDMLSIDGSQGVIYAGAAEVRESRPDALLREIKKWQKKRPAG